MNNKVEWAVIPAAGRGTRFLPITKGTSKEMLNIVDRPTIDYIVEECLNAGIKNIVFINKPTSIILINISLILLLLFAKINAEHKNI